MCIHVCVCGGGGGVGVFTVTAPAYPVKRGHDSEVRDRAVRSKGFVFTREHFFPPPPLPLDPLLCDSFSTLVLFFFFLSLFIPFVRFFPFLFTSFLLVFGSFSLLLLCLIALSLSRFDRFFYSPPGFHLSERSLAERCLRSLSFFFLFLFCTGAIWFDISPRVRMSDWLERRKKFD